MSAKLHTAVAWITLAQVGLVGAFGAGLHSLFGCEHGPLGCGDACCCAASLDEKAKDCHDCAFCKRRASERNQSEEPGCQLTAVACVDCCDGCAVCDLLSQYHSASPFSLEPLTDEPAAREATVQLQNAVVSAATRLALSRGPPVA